LPAGGLSVTTLEVRPEAPADVTNAVGYEPDVDPRLMPVDVEIIVPVYNEAAQLVERVTELRRYLDESFPFRALVTVVDNASTDETFAVARDLAAATPGVAAVHLSRKGRGHALRVGWSTSVARVVAYMDVDLSTSLSALLPLVAPLLSGHRDVATGTRLARGSNVVRGTKRELISRSYNLLLRAALGGKFSDAQCGFKALRTEVVGELLPLVEDEEWFFDTELLITAQRRGLRISEVPVDWVDDPDSRVEIVSTAMSDLRGVWRMSHGPSRRCQVTTSATGSGIDQVTTDQLIRFAGVGVISTLAYAFLFIACQQVVGIFVANALSLALCTACNTLIHAELAHDGSGHAQRGRFVGAAFGLFLFTVALTSVALALVRFAVGPSLTIELLAVTAVSAGAAVLRFAVLRTWIFRTSTTTRLAPRWRLRRMSGAA
jgi:putative flippase GtrA